MRLFKFESRKVRELKDTIADKDACISRLKAENDFLKGKHHPLSEKDNRNIVSYTAVKQINRDDDQKDIPDEQIHEELAKILTEAVAKHMKVKKNEQTELGTMYYAKIDIVEEEQK